MDCQLKGGGLSWGMFAWVVLGLFVLSNVGAEPSAAANGQQPTRPGRARVSIPQGSPVTIDGTVNAQEWEDADSILVSAWSPKPVVVFFKHNGSNLLFAFSDFDEARPLVPEVLIAVDGRLDTVWGPGHWWFHASGQDCWANGWYNDWSTCVSVTPDWEANNPARGDQWPGPLAWELRIPFSTIGLSQESDTVFGIAFDVTDTAQFWFFWPPRAQLGIPATWAEAVLEGQPIHNEDER